jgi:hypothetical protein
MTARAIQLRVDDRVRLMSAVLSATNWPEVEQSHRRYRAHVHARNTARRARAYADHPAVHTLQTLLDQETPLEGIYTFALSLSWPDLALQTPPPWSPPHWEEQLGDFHAQTDLAGWWAEEGELWQRAHEQTAKVLAQADLYTFFKPFVGEVAEQLVLMPNISYPTESEIGVRLAQELHCIAPPRIAWGDNEPWPFDDDPGHIFRGALTEYGRLLMVSYLRQYTKEIAELTRRALPVSDDFRRTHPTWSDQLTGLFVMGAVALFLEQAVGPQEVKAYILMENRVHGVTMLPGVISVLKRYLTEYSEGHYERFIDYLPNFAKHLRVAKGMASI